MKPRDRDNQVEIPSIHYIWVGPPSPISDKQTELGIEVKGHDVDGPLAMADVNKTNLIFYWCLDAHIAAFEKKFEGRNIKVCSIEKYIKQHHDLRIGMDMQAILTQSLQGNVHTNKVNKEGDKVPVRDRVTIKDAFTLFLHATTEQALYTLDTNIKPLTGFTQLPYSEEFQLPFLDTKECDIWMMYSSEHNKGEPKARLAKFYTVWSEGARTEFEKNGYTETYEFMLANAIIGIDNLLSHAGRNWETVSKKDQDAVIIPSLHLKKTYYNSHKPHHLAQRDEKSQESDQAYQALELAKQFIELHQWQLNLGGKPIFVNDKKIKLPTVVFNQWQIIIDALNKKTGYVKAFNEIQEIAMNSVEAENEAEQKKSATASNDSFFSKGLKKITPEIRFGKRTKDTKEYLDLYNQTSVSDFIQTIRAKLPGNATPVITMESAGRRKLTDP